MNKIYKVIWSKTRNCYIVVSEFAKTNSKGSGKRMARILAAGTLALGLIGFSMPGDAADTIAYRNLESGGTTTYNNLYVHVATHEELDTATKKLNAVVNAVDVNAAGETTIHADTAKQLTYNNGSSTISAETLANAANAVGTIKDSTTENGVVKANQTVGQNLNALDDRITNVKNYIQSETAANYVSKVEVSVGEGSDLISNSNTIG